MVNSTPGLVSGRQVPDAAGFRCRTSDSALTLVCGLDGVVRVQIDLLVFDALPQSLDEHVVPPTPFPVHADLNAVVREQPRELLARELAPLVRIEDDRSAILGDGGLNRVQTEIGCECVGQPPRQDRRLAQSSTAKRYMKPAPSEYR